jgi:hypothetical protein
MKYLIAILLLCTLECQTSWSQSTLTNTHTEIKKEDMVKLTKIIDVFFDKYKNESTSNAVDYIFTTNSYTSKNPQLPAIKKTLIIKLDSLRENIGQYTGRDIITEKSTTDNFVLISYLVKHQYQPVRFTFVFYRPEESWMLYKFISDDQVDAELEDAGKIYFIR